MLNQVPKSFSTIVRASTFVFATSLLTQNAFALDSKDAGEALNKATHGEIASGKTVVGSTNLVVSKAPDSLSSKGQSEVIALSVPKSESVTDEPVNAKKKIGVRDTHHAKTKSLASAAGAASASAAGAATASAASDDAIAHNGAHFMTIANEQADEGTGVPYEDDNDVKEEGAVKDAGANDNVNVGSANANGAASGTDAATASSGADAASEAAANAADASAAGVANNQNTAANHLIENALDNVADMVVPKKTAAVSNGEDATASASANGSANGSNEESLIGSVDKAEKLANHPLGPADAANDASSNLLGSDTHSSSSFGYSSGLSGTAATSEGLNSSDHTINRTGPLTNGLNTTQGVVQWLLSTIAVIGVIFGLAFLLRKSRFMQRATGTMRIESQIALGPKERLVRVEVNGRHLLLGVTNNNVNLVLDLDAPVQGSAPIIVQQPLGPLANAMTQDPATAQALAAQAVSQAHQASAAGGPAAEAAASAAAAAASAASAAHAGDPLHEAPPTPVPPVKGGELDAEQQEYMNAIREGAFAGFEETMKQAKAKHTATDAFPPRQDFVASHDAHMGINPYNRHDVNAFYHGAEPRDEMSAPRHEHAQYARSYPQDRRDYARHPSYRDGFDMGRGFSHGPHLKDGSRHQGESAYAPRRYESETLDSLAMRRGASEILRQDTRHERPSFGPDGYRPQSRDGRAANGAYRSDLYHKATNAYDERRSSDRDLARFMAQTPIRAGRTRMKAEYDDYDFVDPTIRGYSSDLYAARKRLNADLDDEMLDYNSSITAHSSAVMAANHDLGNRNGLESRKNREISLQNDEPSHKGLPDFVKAKANDTNNDPSLDLYESYEGATPKGHSFGQEVIKTEDSPSQIIDVVPSFTDFVKGKAHFNEHPVDTHHNYHVSYEGDEAPAATAAKAAAESLKNDDTIGFAAAAAAAHAAVDASSSTAETVTDSATSTAASVAAAAAKAAAEEANAYDAKAKASDADAKAADAAEERDYRLSARSSLRNLKEREHELHDFAGHFKQGRVNSLPNNDVLHDRAMRNKRALQEAEESEREFEQKRAALRDGSLGESNQALAGEASGLGDPSEVQDKGAFKNLFYEEYDKLSRNKAALEALNKSDESFKADKLDLTKENTLELHKNSANQEKAAHLTDGDLQRETYFTDKDAAQNIAGDDVNLEDKKPEINAHADGFLKSEAYEKRSLNSSNAVDNSLYESSSPSIYANRSSQDGFNQENGANNSSFFNVIRKDEDLRDLTSQDEFNSVLMTKDEQNQVKIYDGPQVFSENGLSHNFLAAKEGGLENNTDLDFKVQVKRLGDDLNGPVPASYDIGANKSTFNQIDEHKVKSEDSSTGYVVDLNRYKKGAIEERTGALSNDDKGKENQDAN